MGTPGKIRASFLQILTAFAVGMLVSAFEMPSFFDGGLLNPDADRPLTGPDDGESARQREESSAKDGIIAQQQIDIANLTKRLHAAESAVAETRKVVAELQGELQARMQSPLASDTAPLATVPSSNEESERGALPWNHQTYQPISIGGIVEVKWNNNNHNEILTFTPIVIEPQGEQDLRSYLKYDG